MTLKQEQDGCSVSIADKGTGIPAHERALVLQRFARLDDSRHTAGHGPGLSLVHAVTVLHGSSLGLADVAPGLLVTLRFPAGTRTGGN